jgi:endo-1,4-beta-xylanase
MNLGTMNYQILATESFGGGSGNSTVSVSTGGSTPPPTSAPPTTAPPSTPASGPGSCKATYSVASSWNGGYQATVTVANSGSSAISGWNVGLTLASGQTITSLWNGVNSGTSGAISVKNASYNGSLGAGGSTTFGFTANGNGATAPSNISCTSS